MRLHKAFHKFFDHKKWRHIVGVTIVVVFALGAYVAAVELYPTRQGVAQRTVSTRLAHDTDIRAAAESVVQLCGDKSYKPTCYDEEIPKLMDSMSMEQAFEVTRLVQDQDHSYTYCHVLGHKLSAQETAKDPSKWKDVITRAPSGICSNGAIHGAFQERFRTEALTDEQIVELKPELLDVCEERGTWRPTGLEQASCYHAFGHLVMYITSAEIQKATDLCTELALKDNGKRDFRTLCYDGAYMQIFQPLEPEDFALVKGKQPTKETVAGYCSKFGLEFRGPCWNESWPLFREEILTSGGLEKHCTDPLLGNQANTERCFNAMFYVTTAQQHLDGETIQDFCNGFKTKWINSCFANAASRMIETDYRNITPAVALCKAAKSDKVQAACYQELIKYSTFNFHPGSQESLFLCNSMPDPWKNECLGHRGA